MEDVAALASLASSLAAAGRQPGSPGMRDASTTSQSSITFEQQQQQQFALEATQRVAASFVVLYAQNPKRKKEKSHAKKRKQKTVTTSFRRSSDRCCHFLHKTTTTAATTTHGDEADQTMPVSAAANQLCVRRSLRAAQKEADTAASSASPLPHSSAPGIGCASPENMLKLQASCNSSSSTSPSCALEEEYPVQTSLPLAQLFFLHQLSRLLNLPTETS